MKLEILQVPDCPNVSVLEERIREAIGSELVEVDIVHRVLDTASDAAAAGMTGSPTLLVDGKDPFAVPGQAPSVSCRLYRSEIGAVSGAPSVVALRGALHSADSSTTSGSTPGVAVDCCAPASGESSAAAVLGAWRAAAQPTDPSERAVHHAILLGFASSGQAPAAADLAAVAAKHDASVAQVLERLHTADVIRLSRSGNVESAYPFSAAPTPHRVRIATGAQVYAMCAIDALGIAAMLDTDVAIESVDPSTGEPITVTIRDAIVAAQPPTTVVFVGAQATPGPSADTCCSYLNFFGDRPTAQNWADAHPQVGGIILDLADAQLLGTRIFGNQLRA
ncbi:organomercurial lyase [Nocardia salmonicida]|uniref:Alkylmercury lyase-like protein n=1 Tax=Nocardia fluminea TaxID=134984 RepID=A0A2N3VH93_9NOCA|nr:organomercurial lyase [Nocardia fluminea]PKV80997.1 alkylmercury lyase-like protein [Nocardia fluminea]